MGSEISVKSVTVITVCYNSSDTIQQTIDSVMNQTYGNIEYIIIDGGSTDGTVDKIKDYGSVITKFISEPDDGIYNAFNKGLKNASGDLIAFLNSDDIFASNKVLASVVEEINLKEVDSLWSDIVFVDKNTQEVKRYYTCKNLNRSSFLKGLMPPHPGVYIKKSVYEKYGVFNENYEIASDYDLFLRFFYLKKVSFKYYPKITVKMNEGGISNENIFSTIKLNIEIYRTHKDHRVDISLFSILAKIPTRLLELIKKPKLKDYN